jgi:uncharacterized membrane protein YbhN (UPF0104 family)
VTDAVPPTKRTLRKYAPAAIGIVLMLVCGVFVVRTLANDWHEVRTIVSHASWAWLALALLAASAGMVAIAWTWADALAVVGGRMSRAQSVSWYFVGEIGKYIPGAVWAAVGRGEIARRRGIPGGKAYQSVALSLIGLYLAAALTAVIVVPFDLAHQRDAGPALLLLLLVPIGLVVLHPAVLHRVVAFAERATKRSVDVVVPPWLDTVVLVVRYIPAWIGIAGATWCVARALPGVDAPILRITLATLLSWTAGFVTPTPGGAGVREAVFIGVSGLAAGPAVAVAVTARLLFVLVDVAGALMGLPGTRRKSAADPSVSSPPPDPLRVARDEEG